MYNTVIPILTYNFALTETMSMVAARHRQSVYFCHIKFCIIIKFENVCIFIKQDWNLQGKCVVMIEIKCFL